VCHEIFTSQYNYNHNEINNCLSCFLLCLSFHFLYYSRTDKIYYMELESNTSIHPSPPPPQYAKRGWCATMTLRQYLVCCDCRKVAQHWFSGMLLGLMFGWIRREPRHTDNEGLINTRLQFHLLFYMGMKLGLSP
jgi:hypothetical protein